MTIIFAILVGFIFGFVLQKIGAANPHNLINMLRLKDFSLMKSILFGIGASSFSLFVLLSLGLIEASHISVKGAYIGVIVGGAILGLGWSISGFCPGTGVVAAGTGRKDAMFFILGGLSGALLFTLAYSYLKETFLFDDIAGKSSLIATGNEKFEVLFPSAPSVVVAGVIAAVFILVAWKLPSNQTRTGTGTQ